MPLSHQYVESARLKARPRPKDERSDGFTAKLKGQGFRMQLTSGFVLVNTKQILFYSPTKILIDPKRCI